MKINGEMTLSELQAICKNTEDCPVCKFSVDFKRCFFTEMIPQEYPIYTPKTYLQDFFEKLPNAKKTESGIPNICRDSAYGFQRQCVTSCANCWNEVMPEEE